LAGETTFRMGRKPLHLYLKRFFLCLSVSALGTVLWMELVGLAPFFGDLEVDLQQGWKLHPSLVSGVNRDGYRGRRISPGAPAGCLRIATLGDSSTYGVGRFLPRTTYAGILEKKMNSAGIPCETMNLGVPGYTVVMGIDRLKRYLREYDLDVVTFRFGYNEGIGSRTGLADSNRRLSGAPFFDSEFAKRFRTVGVFQFARAQWAPRQAGLPSGHERVPIDEYRQRVIESVALCRSKGVEPIWLEYVALDACEHLDRYNRVAREACEETGATYVEFPAIRAAGESAYIMNRLHPSGLGHEIIADTVFQALQVTLEARGTLPTAPAP